ncbi:MAG: oligosaccharide flippase family protein, partial [Bilophila sp.]
MRSPCPEQPSLARRYMGKLIANIATVPVYLVMEAILPRALGPQVYGNFNFATSVFTQFTGFLDMGTSTCFYNALSRRQYEMPLVAFYGRASGLVLLITLLAGGLLLIPELGNLLLPDVPLWYAPLAALFGFLTWGARVVRSMNDALGLTVPGELLRSAVNLVGAVLLLVLFGLGWLNAGTLFGLQYLMLGGVVIGCLSIMRRSWQHIDLSLTKAQRKAYTHEFADYSTPL